MDVQPHLLLATSEDNQRLVQHAPATLVQYMQTPIQIVDKSKVVSVEELGRFCTIPSYDSQKSVFVTGAGLHEHFQEISVDLVASIDS